MRPFSFLLPMLVLSLAQAQPAVPVKVTSWGRHYGGQVVYSYQVQNDANEPVKQLLVGHFPDPIRGRAELSEVPAGKRMNFWLTSEGSRSPSGWGALLVYPEESDTFYINWTEASYFYKLWPGAPAAADAPAPVPGNVGIPPGSTENGFVAMVPVEDLAYVKGHATVVFASRSVNVELIPGDTVPPLVTLNVNRVNQNATNGEWAIFNVAFSVVDNFDLSPSSNFEILTSSAPAVGDIVLNKNNAAAWNVKVKNMPGQTYTFRLTASDASGNVAVKDWGYSNPAAKLR